MTRSSVDVIRGGEQVSNEILLGPNPDAPERPMLGVMIVTAFERIEPERSVRMRTWVDLARAVGIGTLVLCPRPAHRQLGSLGVESPG